DEIALAGEHLNVSTFSFRNIDVSGFVDSHSNGPAPELAIAMPNRTPLGDELSRRSVFEYVVGPDVGDVNIVTTGIHRDAEGARRRVRKTRGVGLQWPL